MAPPCWSVSSAEPSSITSTSTNPSAASASHLTAGEGDVYRYRLMIVRSLSVTFAGFFRKFVVTKDNVALMYHAPGKQREFNAFVLDKSYYGPYDETTCIDWTDDSK